MVRVQLPRPRERDLLRRAEERVTTRQIAVCGRCPKIGC
jgi:hypothetical protein